MKRNFDGYFQWFSPGFFAGKRVLEVGPGMGRHTYYLAQTAKEVVAVDLGPAIHVTRKNTARFPNVRCVQADACDLPFPVRSFDFVCAIGVLHHLPEPEAGFQALVRQLKPGGIVHVYLYWALEHAPAWQRLVLGLITFVRKLTVRLPHRLLDAVAFTVAVGGYTGFSLPYRHLSRWNCTRSIAAGLPLQRYARDGFRACYNDQFDRLSAPLEHRYTREQVRSWFVRAGLEDIRVEAHWGWIACGRRPPG